MRPKWHGLRKRYRRNYDAVQQKTDAVQALAEQLGSLNSDSIKAELRIRSLRHRRLFRQLDRLEARLLDIRLASVAARTRNDDKAKQEIQVLSAQEGFLVDTIAELNRDIESATEKYRELGGTAGELEARLQELSALREMTQELQSQIQDLEIGIEAPSPVTVIQSAR